jgi:hypothetical protein
MHVGAPCELWTALMTCQKDVGHSRHSQGERDTTSNDRSFTMNKSMPW